MKTTPLYDTHRQLGATFAEKHVGWNLVAHFTDAVSEHHAVRARVGIADLSHRGRLRLTGEDRAKFLHRIISNDVEGLEVGHGNYATLLTHRGKIIADMHVYVREATLYLETASETTETLFKELDKYIVADDVVLEDVTAETGVIGIYGPQSSDVVQSVLCLQSAPTDVYENRACEVDGRWIMCTHTKETGEIGYQLWTAADSLEWLWERLIARDVNPIGLDALESLRIEAGTPKYGAELTDAVIPLEAELEHAINFEKGCYIGQEIVARMKYRGHPNRLLRGIEIDASEPPQQNEPIFSGDKEVGWITSAVYSPTLKKQIALGYVRTAVTEAGSRVQIAAAEGRVNGKIRILPFYSTNAR